MAFPAISCGIYRFPPERAVLIAVSTVMGFLKRNTDIEKVYFALFDEHLYNLYKDTVEEYEKNK